MECTAFCELLLYLMNSCIYRQTGFGTSMKGLLTCIMVNNLIPAIQFWNLGTHFYCIFHYFGGETQLHKCVSIISQQFKYRN